MFESWQRCSQSCIVGLALVASLQLAVASTEVDGVNSNLTPPFLVWAQNQAGWVFTAGSSYMLDGVYSTFRNVGAASQTGPIVGRNVTLSVFENDAKGALLARASFFADASAGNLGATFTPVLLVAGRKYFFGYEGLNNLSLNIVDWQITAPAPVQPAGTVNLDGWYYGNAYQTYVPRLVNGQLQVFSAPILRFQGTQVSFVAPADCLFRWAETNYATLFAPATAPTATSLTVGPYYYRYYQATNAYVGVSGLDGNVYYIGPTGTLENVGALGQWLSLSACTP